MRERGTIAPELSALGDATRGAIARLLLDADDHALTVGRLTEALALRQPTVSHHLRVLLEAGLVAREPRGREVWYSLSETVAARLEEWAPPSAADSLSGALLGRIIDDLGTRFAGTFSRETVQRVVLDSYDLLRARDGAGRALPSATAQFAAERLSAQETSGLGGERPPGAPLEVLFVCVQNAGRSQLAAAIMRHLGGERVRVRTAGSAPIDAIRPAVVTALDEIGVPLGGEFPKPLTDDVVRAADVVVTMGCGDACPVFPGRRYLDWAVDDPAGQPLDRVRAIRDDIDARVRGLLGELAGRS
ncbi:metalloregulator ArsR/SmtB family transcription factor [Microcella humidisoli]|uniref:Metalloregulator ArsR/SmtB family transcription factor n=1 Tax=Microcella humidisoli TaxID=2963406 RepID=A0ABY5FYE6_9MICO|nr:metalloregulator ArsR/SmtB family transcription factor [Microcella humidisoli]UTT63146.1 metalloregulator ArsR/SmtB family transcription factor [Microcella humidisoli]